MKKRFLISILMVCVLALCMVFVSCNNGGGGGGSSEQKYKGEKYAIDVENFKTAFDITSASETTPFTFVEGNFNELKQKEHNGWDNQVYNSGEQATGATLAEAKAYLQSKASAWNLSSENINQMISRLENPGYFIAYLGGKTVSDSYGGMIGVIAILKE